MRLSRRTLVPVVVVALSLISAEGVAAKCGAPGNPAPFFIVDGSVAPGRVVEERIIADGLDEIDPSNIHSIEITCWNPKTGEFGRGGLPVIRIVTKALDESTRAPIEVLLRAQQAHFSQHSRYAQSLDDLVEFGVPQDAVLEFSATPTGWSATTPRDDVYYRCFVFSGDAPKELARTNEHEIVCQPEAAKASLALRELHEASG